MYHVCPWPQGLGRERERGGIGGRDPGKGRGDFPLVVINSRQQVYEEKEMGTW